MGRLVPKKKAANKSQMAGKDNKPNPEAIRLHLDRILESSDFKASDKQRNFLRFVVDEAQSGRPGELENAIFPDGDALAKVVGGQSV